MWDVFINLLLTFNIFFFHFKTSTNCKSPSYNTILPLINLVAPGFLCLVFFSLLLTNKDCREIWKGCFAKCCNVFELCRPFETKLRAETDRSRCSSTLTVLSDRKDSLPYVGKRVDPLAVKGKQPYPYPSHVGRFLMRAKNQRSSSLTALPMVQPNKTVVERNSVIEIIVSPPPIELDERYRSHSVPVFLSKEIDTQVTSELNKEAVSLANPREGNASEFSSIEDPDMNSETDIFIRETTKEYSSRL